MTPDTVHRVNVNMTLFMVIAALLTFFLMWRGHLAYMLQFE